MRRVVVVLKYLLLLALCVPLGCAGYENGRGLYEIIGVGSRQPPVTDNPAKLRETEALAKGLSHSLGTCRDVVLCVSEKDSDGRIDEGSPVAPIHKCVQERAVALRDTRLFLKIIAEVDASERERNFSAFKDEHPYKQYYLTLTAGRMNTRKRWSKAQASIKQTLVELTKRLNPPSDAALAAKSEVDAMIAALINDLNELRAEAKNLSHDEVVTLDLQLASWNKANDMLTLAEEARKVTKMKDIRAADIRGVLDMHKKLVMESQFSVEFKVLMNDMLVRFRNNCLPKPEDIPLDEFVLVGVREVSVKKTDLMIKLRNGQPSIKFNTFGNEYFVELHINQVETFHWETGEGGPVIKHTAQSKASHKYNEIYSSMGGNWDEPALKQFESLIKMDEDFTKSFQQAASRIANLLKLLDDPDY